LIGRAPTTRGSSTRRLATRAVFVLGAVFLGGQLMRARPRDQTLIFPVGSVFPNATRFAASWRQQGDHEPRGGVSLTFEQAPPLQIRQHTKLPDGDYIVTLTIDILQPPLNRERDGESLNAVRDGQAPENSGARDRLQTNIERRVSLSGGEALIALAVDPREPSVSE